MSRPSSHLKETESYTSPTSSSNAIKRALISDKDLKSFLKGDFYRKMKFEVPYISFLAQTPTVSRYFHSPFFQRMAF
jgi:hypothetical protein